jgi:hypothetical protein
MALNDAEFVGEAGKQALDRAQGGNGEGKGKAAYRGGISSPSPIKFRPGEVLIRIGHSVNRAGEPVPDWKNLTSPWWMTSSTFREIAARSGNSGVAIQLAMRMNLALASDFGVCDTLFWVRVKQPLRAWTGRGFPVMEDPDPAVREASGVPIGWHGGWEIAQNFIPGLCAFRDKVPVGPSAVALAAFDVLPKMPLSEWTSLNDGGFSVLPFPMP